MALYTASRVKRDHSRLAVAATMLLMPAVMTLPLLMRVPFYTDWINHVWSVNYVQKYLIQNGDFPLFFNAQSAAGNPAPIFYGFIFYPLLALAATVSSADIAIRLGAMILVLLHISLYYSIGRRFLPRIISLFIATLSVASVYQTSNLYNRSALTEFFSYELFAIAFPVLIASIYFFDRIRTDLFVTSLGLMIAAAGMHPPTAYSAAVFVSPLILVTIITLFRYKRPRLSLAHILATGVACCVMLPWAYIVVRYGSRLAINHDPGHVPGLIYFPTSIDSILGKLGWLYLDRRTLADGVAQTSTPFLNASLQVPLGLAVLILVSLVWPSAPRSFRFGIVLMAATCATTVVLGLRPPSSLLVPTPYSYSDVLPAGRFFLYDLVDPLQFAYRLTNTISLQLSIALMYVLFHGGRLDLRISYLPATFLAGLVVLSFAAMWVQDLAIFTEFSFYRSHALVAPASPQVQANEAVLKMTWQHYLQQTANTAEYPEVFYSQANYAMLDIAATRDFANDPTPWTLASFVGTQAKPLLTTDCTVRCLVQTNLVPSVFVTLTLDGIPVPHDEINSISNRLAFMAAAGPHSVGFQPVGKVLFFFTIARWVGLTWVCGSILNLSVALVRRPFREAVPT